MCCPSVPLWGPWGGSALLFRGWHWVNAQRASAWGNGRARLQDRAEEEEEKAHPMPSVPSHVYTRGEVKGEGGRDKSWGQNDSGVLNTGVHLDLIGSNAPFQTPSAYLRRSLETGLLSHCESVILQIYSCLRSHYSRCQRRNPSCQGAASHEKERQRQQARQTKQSPPLQA